MRPRLKVYGFLAIFALLAAGGYFGYQLKFGTAQADGQKAEASKKQSPDAVPVEVAKAVSGQISSYLISTANLRALRDVDVASQAEGIIRSVAVEEGDSVKAGQVLCSLDDTQLKIRLETAEQRLAQARLQLEKGRVRQEKTEAQIRNGREDLQRYQRLFDDRLVSERDVALLRYKIEELEHDQRVSNSETRELTHRVDELVAEIAQVNLEISRTQIRAPFGGYITQRSVNIGQVVRNLEAVFKLSDFSPLFADVHLAEAEAGQVKPGQAAVVRLGTNLSDQLTAHVARISPVVDQSSGTVKVTVEMKEPRGGFKPGAFVRVEIKTDTRQNAVLIPKKAVIEEDGLHFVFVANKDSASRVKVTLGYQREDQTEVLGGLKVGQQVVVAGQGSLKKGSKIRVIQS